MNEIDKHKRDKTRLRSLLRLLRFLHTLGVIGVAEYIEAAKPAYGLTYKIGAHEEEDE